MDLDRIDALKWWLTKYARMGTTCAADALAYICQLEEQIRIYGVFGIVG